jgi:hypothetical protein
MSITETLAMLLLGCIALIAVMVYYQNSSLTETFVDFVRRHSGRCGMVGDDAISVLECEAGDTDEGEEYYEDDNHALRGEDEWGDVHEHFGEDPQPLYAITTLNKKHLSKRT